MAVLVNQMNFHSLAADCRQVFATANGSTQGFLRFLFNSVMDGNYSHASTYAMLSLENGLRRIINESNLRWLRNNEEVEDKILQIAADYTEDMKEFRL